MHFTASASTRYANYVMKQRRTLKALYHTTCECVIETVHPGNLGALPPSPKVLAYKANQIGLITDDEYWKLTMGPYY